MSWDLIETWISSSAFPKALLENSKLHLFKKGIHMDDQIVKRIVETNSTTNSEQEIKMGQVICELIGSQPYFQNHSMF